MDLPLIQAVEVGGEVEYAAWWRRAAAVAGLLTLLCFGVVVLCFALGRELRWRAIAEEALVRLAATDPLTGLANRRSFDGALSAAWSKAAEAGEAVAMLMVDADAFKSYNDLFGNHAGDDVLRALAGCLGAVAGDRGGVACRWGGEEFALLLPSLGEADALAAAEALCTTERARRGASPRGRRDPHGQRRSVGGPSGRWQFDQVVDG